MTSEEIEEIPWEFAQDEINVNDCTVARYDGRQYKAGPEECLELERSAVWDERSIIERIEDEFAGKKNFHREAQRVLLSKDDIRYQNPNLRWNFEKQVFY